jgi:allantoin racemase
MLYREYVSKSIEVLVLPTEGGPDSTDSRYEETLAGPYIISTAKKLSEHGLSALIVSCFGDPTVGALREIFDFPIIGPGEASILTGSMLGDKFSIITILENGIPMIEDLVRRIGFHSRLASVRAIGIEPQDLERDLKRTEAATIEQARLAIQEDGASVLIVGCNSPEMARTADKLNASLQVPVINPVRAAVNAAESLAKQGLRNSSRTYHSPISEGRKP